MLTALIIVVNGSENKELPVNNGQLFQMLIRALAKREAKRLSTGWLPFEERFSTIEKALANLAFAMIDEEKGTEVALQYSLKYLNNEIIQSATSANFLELTASTVRFYHQLMHEYFAAQYIIAQNIPIIKTVHALLNYKSPWHRQRDKWYQTLQIYYELLTESQIYHSLSYLIPLMIERLDALEKRKDELKRMKLHEEAGGYISAYFFDHMDAVENMIEEIHYDLNKELKRVYKLLNQIVVSDALPQKDVNRLLDYAKSTGLDRMSLP